MDISVCSSAWYGSLTRKYPVFHPFPEDLRTRLFSQDVISTIKGLLIQNKRDDKKKDALAFLVQTVEYRKTFHYFVIKLTLLGNDLPELFDKDTIDIVHGFLLRSPRDVRQEAIPLLEKSMRYSAPHSFFSSRSNCAIADLRSRLFDDKLFQELVKSFRESGPYNPSNLDVRILGIGLQWGQTRNQSMV
jgi:hypothetical protein